MFETEDFKKRLEEVLIRAAALEDVDNYDSEIVTYLQKLASQNESVLMERELRKAAAERRGLRDALVSAGELAALASRYAASKKQTVVKLADMERALKDKFCQVWPFCKP